MHHGKIRHSDMAKARDYVGEDIAYPVVVRGHYSLETGEPLPLPHEPEECSNVRCILACIED